MRAVLAPLVARITWRRWAYLVLGGALLMPYMMVGQLLTITVAGAGSAAGLPLAAVQPRIFLGVLPVVLLSGLVLPVRAFEVAATRELVRPPGDIAADDRRSWGQRWRTAAWFTVHVGVGGIVSGLTLALVPFALWLAAVGLAGDTAGVPGPALVLPAGWSPVWALPAAVLVLLALGWLIVACGALLARLAPALLGPTPADRLAALERRAAQLAERNRLARELHDSVGHALSVVTVQAAAGARVLDSDPRFARDALGAIEESARSALVDLDHVLGVLRDGGDSASAPLPTLADLDDLLARTRAAGVTVHATVDPDVATVPAAVSREAYRILQEAVTNTLRHAGTVPVALQAVVGGDRLELDVSNPLGDRVAARTGGGRGLAGIRERVAVLGGDMRAGVHDGRWDLHVSLPL